MQVNYLIEMNIDEYGLQPTQNDNPLDQILEISDDDNAKLESRIYDSDYEGDENFDDFSDVATQRDVNNSIDTGIPDYASQESFEEVTDKGNNLPDEIKGIIYSKPSYNKLINSIENDFKENLTLHLYSSYLTRINNNLQFPSQYWYAWPLNTSQVPDPKSNKKYTDFNDITNIYLQKKFERIEQKKRIPNAVEMSNPHLELRYEFDNLYQKLLFKKRALLFPETVPFEILGKFINKFNELIEKIIMNQLPFAPRKKTSIYLQKMLQHPKKRGQKQLLLDWTDILALVASNDSDDANIKINYSKILKKCEKLFIDRARNYIKPEYKLNKYQRNLKAKRIFKRALKRVEKKRILAQKIIQRKQIRSVSYSKSKSSKMYRKNVRLNGNSLVLQDKGIEDIYLIR